MEGAGAMAERSFDWEIPDDGLIASNWLNGGQG